MCVINVVFSWVGDNARGGSPGAQRFQEKTRLRPGDIRRFTGGKLKACVCACVCCVWCMAVPGMKLCLWCLWSDWLQLFLQPWLRSTVKIGFTRPPFHCARFLAGLPQILRVRVHGARVSVSRCGLLPLHPHSESPDSPTVAGAHRQTHLRCGWVLLLFLRFCLSHKCVSILTSGFFFFAFFLTSSWWIRARYFKIFSF